MLGFKEVEKRYQLLSDNISKLNPKAEIIAVTKTNPVEVYHYCHRLGIKNVGENRIQEVVEKRKNFENEVKTHDLNFHFIGQLQKNKAKFFTDTIDSFDTLSSETILHALERRWESQTVRKIMIQINSSRENQKNGIEIDDIKKIYSLVEQIIETDGFIFEGYMTMGPTPADNYTIENEEYRKNTRDAFRNLRKLKEQTEKDYEIKLPRLSMGMSHDYPIALDEGSTEIRVGSALFGERNYN